MLRWIIAQDSDRLVGEGAGRNIKVRNLDGMWCLAVGDGAPDHNDVVLARFNSESEVVDVLGELAYWLGHEQTGDLLNLALEYPRISTTDHTGTDPQEA